MDAVGRAEEDLRQGDYAKARQRLESYLNRAGYQPELLAWIGRIAYDMHDLHTAGRMWLLSTAEGEDVDRAIGIFLQTASSAPRQALLQIPRPARLATLAAYPAPVQNRLQSLGLANEIPRVYQPRPVPGSKVTAGTRVMGIVFFAALLLFVGSCTVGVVTIVSWVLPD